MTNDFFLSNVLIPDNDSYTAVDVQISGTQLQTIAPAGSQLSPNELDRADSVTIVPGDDKLLLPGFVNGHTHSSQIWQRGLVRPLPLELWLADVYDAAPKLDLEEIYLGALSTAIDTVMSGGTCVMDHVLLSFDHELESMAAVVKAYREVGIRAFIAPLIMDSAMITGLPKGRSQPHSPYPRSTSAILETMAAIVAEFHRPEAGIHVAIGPTGFHRCSDELLIGCADLSDRYNLCRHAHLLETKAQKLLASEKYGSSAVAHLKQLGFLDHRTSLAHGVWLEDADLDILAETRSTLVHNPVSNLRLGSGIAPVLKALQKGVNVSFGCDGAASNDAQDLLEAIKLGTMLHTITDPDYQNWLTPRRAIAMASLGGATGVNLAAQIGSLEMGKAADVVLYDLNHLSMLPRTDPIQQLVLGRPTQVVDSVWVKGKRLVAEGKLLTVDVEALRQELLSRSQSDRSHPFQTINQIEPHYRTLLAQE
ncbi:MAG: amidohydrolase [Leptolyngbyaceae cyanobacterium bins.302]|nr:amidohydrolase [Leptolyngbyaceae cyanobacterium bins.302]